MATMMLWAWTELGDVHELGMGRIYVTPAELRSGSDASARPHAGQERSRAGDSTAVSQAQTEAGRMERAGRSGGDPKHMGWQTGIKRRKIDLCV